MDHISDRLNRLSESQTLAMTRKSRELRAKGFDVINLSIGEPDFDTPQFIKEAAIGAINDNFTHYPPVPGYEDLLQAISTKFKRDNNLDYSLQQIRIVCKHRKRNNVVGVLWERGYADCLILKCFCHLSCA